MNEDDKVIVYTAIMFFVLIICIFTLVIGIHKKQLAKNELIEYKLKVQSLEQLNYTITNVYPTSYTKEEITTEQMDSIATNILAAILPYRTTAYCVLIPDNDTISLDCKGI